jgi:hypothetical protein
VNMTNQHLRRVLRPVGKVTPALKRHGYRQVAIILIDGKQVDNVCVLSIKDGNKIKFVGQFIDTNGELYTTNKFTDMKRAAGRIMAIAASHTPTGAVCKGCGTIHPDEDMCPE